MLVIRRRVRSLSPRLLVYCSVSWFFYLSFDLRELLVMAATLALSESAAPWHNDRCSLIDSPLYILRALPDLVQAAHLNRRCLVQSFRPRRQFFWALFWRRFDAFEILESSQRFVHFNHDHSADLDVWQIARTEPFSQSSFRNADIGSEVIWAHKLPALQIIDGACVFNRHTPIVLFGVMGVLLKHEERRNLYSSHSADASSL
jgi:hypothetical protein